MVLWFSVNKIPGPGFGGILVHFDSLWVWWNIGALDSLWVWLNIGALWLALGLAEYWWTSFFSFFVFCFYLFYFIFFWGGAVSSAVGREHNYWSGGWRFHPCAALSMFLALQSIKNCFYFNRSSAISAQVVTFLIITRKYEKNAWSKLVVMERKQLLYLCKHFERP